MYRNRVTDSVPTALATASAKNSPSTQSKAYS